ncbi:MAG: hypothetical protein ABI884_02915 [Gemmatimonadota bacterium]
MGPRSHPLLRCFMRRHRYVPARRVALRWALLCGAPIAAAGNARAQGCMPVRFTSPNLNGKDNSYLNDHGWQLGVGYRWLHADRFYVGHAYEPGLSPGAKPIEITDHTLNLSATYAFTNHFSVELDVPFEANRESFIQGDGLRHGSSSTSMGDISVVGNVWLLQPLDHANGNVSLSLGVKAPTGSTDKTGAFYTSSSSTVTVPDNNTIQSGDGGWGIVLQTSAFRRLAGRLSAYAAGDYLVSPKSHTNVPAPAVLGGALTGVTDEYSAHAGLGFALAPKRGISVSLGGRIDGVPVHDLVGGGDQYFRRPGYTIYAEPALSLTFAKSPFSRLGSTLSLSVPVALDQNREASVGEQRSGTHYGGNFARYLIFLNYSIRP